MSNSATLPLLPLHTDHLLVQKLVATIELLGVEHIVLSPGSRSAPLVQEFNAYTRFAKTVIFDERSAAYCALGMAQQTQKPVVLVCTSGTALLNYAPAICEAFYQKIPLLVLTADRPESMLGKGENQTITQQNIYANYILASYQLIENTDLAVAILHSLFPIKGPVHINIPLQEPLYGTLEKGMELGTLSGSISKPNMLSKSDKLELKENWNKKQRKLIICGKDNFNAFKLSLLKKVNEQSDVVLLAEPLANVFIENSIQNTDGFIASLHKDIKPDLVVTIGQQVLSKRLRTWLKNMDNVTHWHISEMNEQWDIFDKLSTVWSCTDTDFLKVIANNTPADSNWKKSLLEIDQKSKQTTALFGNDEWSDFFIFQTLSKQIPKDSIIQWGNSSVIRYASLFSYAENMLHYANRGTSGIDGCLSTAVGCAMVNPQKTVFAVLGDISFFYDSNALFISPFPKNLKIIVINNEGGSIFRMIAGQQDESLLQPYFEARHSHTTKHFASMFHLPYYFCDQLPDAGKTISAFLELDSQASILELKTSPEISTNLFKQYFKTLST